MKRIIFSLIILIVFSLTPTFAQQQFQGSNQNQDGQNTTLATAKSPKERFNLGNQLYDAGQYDQAIKTYETIVDLGYTSALVYFNLGNAYYKNGNIPKAILNYERAQLIDPNDKDIAFNIALCNQFVVDKIEALPRPFFVDWFHSLVNTQGADGWAKIGLLTFLLTIVLGLAFVLAASPVLKKISFWVGVLLLIITLTSWGFAARQKEKASNPNTAIVFSPTVTVKASPDDSGTALFVIHQGLKVSILETLGSWYKIQLLDGNVGWVKKEILELI
jgi:tetratricopeptide (TPR) repeat protein